MYVDMSKYGLVRDRQAGGHCTQPMAKSMAFEMSFLFETLYPTCQSDTIDTIRGTDMWNRGRGLALLLHQDFKQSSQTIHIFILHLYRPLPPHLRLLLDSTSLRPNSHRLNDFVAKSSLILHFSIIILWHLPYTLASSA
jgi:hypothetical protein